MSGHGTRRRRRIGRLAVGLLSVAAMVLMAPVALAQPEVEANDAITAAWQASGGDGGVLGPKQGEVYAVGSGFAQDFTGGKMFFTPATGAHHMSGPILEKYESLGGPADSDLGFPTIDEGPGRAPNSLNSTFSASDSPVIFWTPDTGARVVRGPINAAWDQLGGSSGALGVPAEDERYQGDVVAQRFTGGELSYNAKTKTFTTVPPELATQLEGLQVPADPVGAINAARRAAGGTMGPLGAAEGPPYSIGADGMGQNFAGGKIFYSPATGANVVTGQVLDKYESVGGPEGDLGFPVTGEVDGGITNSRMSTFAAEDKPLIFWTPDYGAVIVRGPINAAWAKLDGGKGPLGAPMSDQTEDGDVITQRFSGGVISWDRSTNSFKTEPANLALELAGLELPGQSGPPASAPPQAADRNDGQGFQWSWWWLLAIVPALILIGLVAYATLRNRRGRGGDDEFALSRDEPHQAEFDDAHYDDGGFGAADDEAGYSAASAAEPAEYGAAEPAEYGDDYDATLFGDRYAREGLGSLAPAAGAASTAEPSSPWEAPPPGDVGAVPYAELDVDHDVEHDVDHDVEQPVTDEVDEEDPDDVDTAPTRVPTELERNPLTDTGRHARIEPDELEPAQPAFRLPLADSDEAPEGYPVKADTKTGRYWLPDSADYDDAQAEIWFSSEEFARANGFLRAD
ncbi:LGFP repeat-containing protein [Mycolicibacterium holsaticum]|uniref:LGFP repeat-containing protein n=1 Tax=Mycolicibacterium holsaticum TaxID=152142 RepID=UPI001C7D84B3|nr:hypothetical protein [Mycolicibacterium holsaticum]QZA10711.1 hypothetical protein K3U96_15645 [Mycolicibacterium holsaticum DSM 44478 = JCM 12374]